MTAKPTSQPPRATTLRSRGIAIVLGAIAIYTVVVVVIAVASGKRHADVFWPTVILLILFAAWAAKRAWRVLSARRDPPALKR